ncbi:MAG: protein kinase, partial [Deltaproteobacteria bacterium]|nr:protein kinase [Deltaproteobacteria bacterium]
MQAVSPWVELRRRGVLGALAAYVVVVAGALQLADVVSHGLDLPSWTMKLMIWLSVAGLPVVGVISWFYDLTKAGLVRTEAPRERVVGGSPPLVQMPSPVQGQTPQQTPGGSKPMDGAALNADSAPLAGRYRIERELGSGGMGRVLSAHDEKLGRRVAIKVLTGAHDAGRLARFSQEARAAGALEHPNVVAVYDLGEHEGAPFLVTELLDGATLREVVNKGPLEPEIARKLAVQLARGLEAAHARGVVHRDLKPENLFLTRDGRLKILDFGLAKLTGPTEEPRGPGLTATGAIFGTPGYLAPEQAKGLSSDSRADIFAVGAVLYELLSGRRAFPGSTLVEAGHAALTQEPPPYGRAIPQDLARIVARCLEKDPAKRFADGAELVKALERVELAVLAGMDAQAIEGPSLSERWAGLPQWFKNALYVVVILGVGSALLDLRPGARNRAAQKKWEQQVLEDAMREGRMTPVQPMSPVSPVAPMAPTPPMMGARGGTRGTPIPTPRPMPSPHAMPTPPTAHEEERGLDDDTPPDADAELDKAQAELEKQAVKLPQLKAVQEQIKAAIASQKLNKLTSRSGVLTGAHSLAMAGQ